MNVQPRKTAVRSRRIHSLSASDLSANEPRVAAITVGVISDAASVQSALSAVINAVAAGTLDPARARVLLYGLQIAATNAHRMAANAKKEDAAQPVEQAGADVPVAVVESVTSATVEEPRAVLCEETNNAKQDEDAIENCSESAAEQAEAETHTQSNTFSEQGHIPPASFSPEHGYAKSFRERMLAMQAQSRARSAL